MNAETKKQFEEYKKLIEQKLDEFLPVQYPEEIWESMRYSVLAGGKRLRPLMALETCRVLSGCFEQAIPTACAIEMLHSQSLIHDDLPCMDDDDYRRGKLTNHKVFGESTAVLAGDALLSFAPQIILQKTEIGKNGVTQDKLLKVLEEFLVSAGAEKLIAGQVVDIASEGKEISQETSYRNTRLNRCFNRLCFRLCQSCIYGFCRCYRIRVYRRYQVRRCSF